MDLYEAWFIWPQRWGLAGPSHPGIIAPDQCDETVYGPPLITFVAAGHQTTDRLYRWRTGDGWMRREAGVDWVPV